MVTTMILLKFDSHYEMHPLHTNRNTTFQDTTYRLNFCDLSEQFQSKVNFDDYINNLEKLYGIEIEKEEKFEHQITK